MKTARSCPRRASALSAISGVSAPAASARAAKSASTASTSAGRSAIRSGDSEEVVPIPLARPVPAQAEELQDQLHLAGQHGQPRVRDAAPGGGLAQ